MMDEEAMADIIYLMMLDEELLTKIIYMMMLDEELLAEVWEMWKTIPFSNGKAEASLMSVLLYHENTLWHCLAVKSHLASGNKSF